MRTSLQGKVAIITGASRGIGRSIATSLAKEGVAVVLTARTEIDLQETEKQCEQFGVQTLRLPAHLSVRESWKEIIEKTEKQFSRLDILINNAGVFLDKGPADEANLEDWEQTIDTNLRALMGLTRYALPLLEKQPTSAIINIASVAAKQGSAGRASYCASKHGILGFSEALFEDVREKGVKVCTLCPAYVDTKMAQSPFLDAHKMIHPEDIAEAVLLVLQLPKETCITEMTIRTQYTTAKKRER